LALWRWNIGIKHMERVSTEGNSVMNTYRSVCKLYPILFRSLRDYSLRSNPQKHRGLICWSLKNWSFTLHVPSKSVWLSLISITVQWLRCCAAQHPTWSCKLKYSRLMLALPQIAVDMKYITAKFKYGGDLLWICA
jgi:hypothetical protein